VKLIIQPEDGLAPLLKAVRKAKKTVDIVIFRFDREELEEALEAAVARNVVVRALIAHTNRGGERTLRKLEMRLLKSGVIVARTADDLPRYHGKMMIVDGTLYVFGFNYTKLDIVKSRSFGIMTRDKKLVKEGRALFEADAARNPYVPSHPRLVVSPETSRARLAAFIKRARKELLIYDTQVSDNAIQKLLQDRVAAGVSVRILGRLEKAIDGIAVRKLAGLRLHVRAIVRDGAFAFVGSQSLRKLELDGRREVGVIISDARIAKRIQSVFESDWKLSGGKVADATSAA
jgi:phosphatidylserine/phosphatidylglycerophosphate/cardiolipin synthase-like enzyme